MHSRTHTQKHTLSPARICTGSVGGESSKQALQTFQQLATAVAGPKAPLLPTGAKRRLLNKLKSSPVYGSDPRIASLALANFDPTMFIPELHAALGRPGVVTGATTLYDLFAPEFDAEFYQRLFNITKERMGANYTALANFTTFSRSSIDLFSQGMDSRSQCLTSPSLSMGSSPPRSIPPPTPLTLCLLAVFFFFPRIEHRTKTQSSGMFSPGIPSSPTYVHIFS